MRFKITLKNGFAVVGEGEITFNMKEIEDTSRHTDPERIETDKESKVGRWMLEVEQAINSSHSVSLRAHIDLINVT